MTVMIKFKVGYIPEHYSTPILFAKNKGFFAKHLLDIQLIPYPSGSGQLIQHLEEGKLDLAIGLTEAFIRSIALGSRGHHIIGTYVCSPLCWSISTGIDRDDINSEKDLEGKRIGVSRVGSGSYVMPFVLGMQNSFKQPFYDCFVVLDNFKRLRDSVNKKEQPECDAFLWEHFTTKKYYDNKEVKKVGEIYTPWPSWVITARRELELKAKKHLFSFLSGLKEGIQYFKEHEEEGIEYICTNLDYNEEDARAWLKTVEFEEELVGVGWEDVENCYKTLIQAELLHDSERTIIYRLEDFVDIA